MPSNKGIANQGYVLEKVTIRELFENGDTKETSEKSLRERARNRILVHVESIGNKHYYDRRLSTIRCKAARRCIRAGVKWADIIDAFNSISLNNDTLKQQLNEGKSLETLEDELAGELNSIIISNR